MLDTRCWMQDTAPANRPPPIVYQASSIEHQQLPVREAAVLAVEERGVSGLEWVRRAGFFIERDAEARLHRRQQISALELDLLGEDVGQDRSRAARQLEHAEVRGREREVQAG